MRACGTYAQAIMIGFTTVRYPSRERASESMMEIGCQARNRMPRADYLGYVSASVPCPQIPTHKYNKDRCISSTSSKDLCSLSSGH